MKKLFILILFLMTSFLSLLKAAEFSAGVKFSVQANSPDAIPFCATKETAILICQEAGFDFAALDDKNENLNDDSYETVPTATVCRISPKTNDFVRFRGTSKKLLKFVTCHMKTARAEFSTINSSTQKTVNHYLIYKL